MRITLDCLSVITCGYVTLLRLYIDKGLYRKLLLGLYNKSLFILSSYVSRRLMSNDRNC